MVSLKCVRGSRLHVSATNCRYVGGRVMWILLTSGLGLRSLGTREEALD